MTGRPITLTDEVKDRVVQFLTDGNTTEAACALAGIGESTFYAWMKRGEQAIEGDEAFVEFREAARKAMFVKEAKANQMVTQAMRDGDLGIAKWYLSFREGQRARTLVEEVQQTEAERTIDERQNLAVKLAERSPAVRSAMNQYLAALSHAKAEMDADG